MDLTNMPLMGMLREKMSWLNTRQGLLSQNVANADESLTIRLLAGRREGKADTNQFDEKSLRRAVDAA